MHDRRPRALDNVPLSWGLLWLTLAGWLVWGGAAWAIVALIHNPPSWRAVGIFCAAALACLATEVAYRVWKGKQR